jgi:hypothetical protein
MGGFEARLIRTGFQKLMLLLTLLLLMAVMLILLLIPVSADRVDDPLLDYRPQ